MLGKVGFKSWAKHAFNPLVLNDSITNNISEIWNKVLLPARQKPILSMLEWIRRRLMTRIQHKREKMEKYRGVICPGIVVEIEELKKGLKRCNVRFSGNDEFEVDEINELDMNTYVVDLKKYQCNCEIWRLSGIPCLHVLKCITSYNLRVEEYVHPSYYKEKHLIAYSGIIHPIPDESLWDDLMRGKMLPPPWRNSPGRPKGKRRKGPNEQTNPRKMLRTQETIKCKNCGQHGHNIRTCQNEHVVPPPKSKSKGGRPKCDVIGRVYSADEIEQGEPKQKRKYTRKPTYKRLVYILKDTLLYIFYFKCFMPCLFSPTVRMLQDLS
ncbi:hypothetical protein KSP39_PZI015762 [Platanthera zijinensis]|uniref:SWIM-type domain-containing protein n=1 Tax=Platanthera zijinensis TaxID=2320716 RepID=A0AAP0B8C7_9ASPA